MNRTDDVVRLGCQKAEQVVRRLAFLDLSHAGPIRPDAGKECERSRVIERRSNIPAGRLVEFTK